MENRRKLITNTENISNAALKLKALTLYTDDTFFPLFILSPPLRLTPSFSSVSDTANIVLSLSPFPLQQLPERGPTDHSPILIQFTFPPFSVQISDTQTSQKLPTITE